MAGEREQSEGQTVFDMQGGEGTDMEEVHGDDQGLAGTSLADQVAQVVVGERDEYLPVESLKRIAATLLVYGGRVDGPTGILLNVAGNAIVAAVDMYVNEYGEFALGDAPDYHTERP